jgi:rhamnulose-1-phosphate aldolase
MQKLIDEIKKTSGDMARRGWAESNGGNISLRLNDENYKYFNGFPPKSDWVKLPMVMPEIAGERFMVTGTGRFLRNIELFTEKNIVVI